MRKALQVFLGLFGGIDILISLLHIVLGPSAIPGSVPVNATMDSEDRFYATLFTAYGVAILWCIKDIERKGPAIRFLALTFFVGGVARLVSMALVGVARTLLHRHDAARAAAAAADGAGAAAGRPARSRSRIPSSVATS